MEDKNIFPKGTCVVLKQGCITPNCWVSIPIDYIYKLRQPSTMYIFKIEYDIEGKRNGWGMGYPTISNNLILEKATIEQVIAYEFLGVCYKDSFKKTLEYITVKIKRKSVLTL